jgi:hypothetical protein
LNVRTRGFAGGVLLLLVLGLFAWGLRQVFTSRFPGGNDLYPRWSAGCAWLLQGIDPYSQAATTSIQEGIYGRAALPGEDQAAFAYPIFTVFVTSPLCLATDFATAHAVAMTALIAALILTAALARRAAGWQVGGALWIWTLFWIVALYPSARAVILGQLAVIVALLQVGALVALRGKRDALAGAALALSLIKPQMAVLIVPWLLLWGAANRRWKILWGFAAALAVLVIVPMMRLPAWPVGWVHQLQAYRSYTEFGSLTWIITTDWLGTPPAVEAVVTLLWMVWLLTEWWRARRDSFEPMLWTASLTIVLTHFVSPRTATTHFAPMLVPLFMLFRVLSGPAGDRRKATIAAITAGTALASWALFALTVQGRQESAWNYLPIPILMLGVLLAIRRPWKRLTGEPA